ncbi:MAG: tRNA (adenosine(37)-N6)-threonylcarbamoyltransferase complex transferase subunit TsaD [Christensenellales bacterium]
MGYNDYRVVSSTVDDAAGEAFDKVARTLGLPYPGGPQIDRLSTSGKPVFDLPSPLLKNGNLSYSGLKTAVVNLMHNAAQRGEKLPAEDVCASFSRAALEPLLSLAEKHLKRLGLKTLALAGGVAANGYLRGRAESLARKNGFKLFLPEKKLCTDNGAMVASQGYFLLAEKGVNCDLTLNAEPTLRLRGDRPSRR